MSKWLPLLARRNELMAVGLFVCSVGALLMALLVHMLCTKAQLPGELEQLVCKIDSVTWSISHYIPVAATVAVYLFFGSSVIRFVKFPRWYSEFQSEFNIADDHIIALMRKYDTAGMDESIANAMYARYRTINPMIGSGKQGVAINAIVSSVAVVILTILITMAKLR